MKNMQQFGLWANCCYIFIRALRDGRGMGTPSPLRGNRNPAPGKHNKPGSDWGVIKLRFGSTQVIKHIIKAGRTISIDII
jgi:hypothetical protein